MGRDHFLAVCLLFSVAQKVSPLWRSSPSCRRVRKAWTKEIRVRGVFSWSVKMHVYSLRPLHLCSSLRFHQRPLLTVLFLSIFLHVAGVAAWRSSPSCRGV